MHGEPEALSDTKWKRGRRKKEVGEHLKSMKNKPKYGLDQQYSPLGHHDKFLACLHMAKTALYLAVLTETNLDQDTARWHDTSEPKK